VEVLTETWPIEVTRIGAGRVASAGLAGNEVSSDGSKSLRDTRDFLGVVGGENKNERAEAAERTRETMATCFAPDHPHSAIGLYTLILARPHTRVTFSFGN
jgi:hypothetical protein